MFICCLGVIVWGSSDAAYAGAWTLEQGQGAAFVTATATSADEAFDGGRRLVPTPRYDKEELQALAEYGVTDWLTAIISPGLQHVDIADPVNAQRTGFGYTELGGRVRFLNGDRWVLSGQATTRIPGTFDTQNPAAIGYNGVENDVRLLFGYAFTVNDWPAFVDVQLAQRFRTGSPPDELRADITVGIRPYPHWLVLAQVFNVVSEGAGPPIFPSYDYSKFQFSAVHELSAQWSVQVGVVTTFSGRNALQENGLIFGAWYRF